MTITTPARKRERASEPTSDQSAGATFDTLTKFDEIAIVKAFGEDLYTLRNKPFDFLRCLAFTHQRRAGLAHDEAREAAFNLTIGQLGDYFADDPEEIDPEDPDTDEGKGDSLTE